MRHAFSKICYVTQNMARSSSNKQSTSAPPADAVARSARATVADKSPRVVLSPRSRAAFERRVAQNQAHFAAVTAFYTKEKAAKDAAAAANTQAVTDATAAAPSTAATMTTIAAAPSESSEAVREKSTATKKKGTGKGTKEPKAVNDNEPKAVSGGKKKTKKTIRSGKEKIICDREDSR